MRPRPIIVAVAVAIALVGTGCGDMSNGVTINHSESAGSGSAADTTATTNTDAANTTDAATTTDADTNTTDTGASDTTDTGTGTGTGDGPPVEPIDWQEFGEGLEFGSLIVPIDYDDPSRGTFDLFVVRHPATDQDKRIGTLLVNPGGPGVGGSYLAQAAENIYSEDLLDRFDIVAWDPRGTGLSSPAIDCIDDYDKYYAAEYDGLTDEEARQKSEDLAVDFVQRCEDSNGDILNDVGTNNSARDMDTLRRALGEATISYFGFSYGSELGATWATLFPDTVRAAVLDGASDPNADPLQRSLAQQRGFERSLNTFLARCSGDPVCVFHNDGDAEGAFDALADSLAETPIPSEPGRPDVEPGVLISAVIDAMYSEFLWPQLAQALADAQAGDGSGLLALHDDYFQRRPDGTYDNLFEAFQMIRCADTTERLTVEEEDALAPLYAEAAPRLNGEAEGGSYFCTFFPASTDPRIDITAAGAGPILVVGTTGDPATPLESSENMAKTLEEGVLLVVEAEQHTGYGVNGCSMSTVDAYLIDLAVPVDGTEC